MANSTDALAETQVDGGGYELIRARLLQHAETLRERAEALNAKRRDAFGSSDWKLSGNERIRTENNCIPRDTVMVGGHLLFGYNVFLGLKTETVVADVLSLHRFTEKDGTWDVAELSHDDPAASFLRDVQFVRDFAELYRFYKTARLVRLSRSETKLWASFQIGQNADDIRVFRWALASDGSAHYVDNRGERDLSAPPQHCFEWTAASPEHQISGPHSHVAILDQVFVDTLGGQLTIKIENNTQSGEGIHSEAVDDPRQSLSDASFEYAKVGTLILLRIKPYNEQAYRHFVYATRMRSVSRIDAIGKACAELPEDHGIVFPGGYYLQDGRCKLFDDDYSGFDYEGVVRSPNGEDVMFVFHHQENGRYALFSYNLVQKELRSPVLCNGYSIFDDGRVIVLQDHAGEPTRVHQLRIWETPFVSAEYAARAPSKAGPLGKIGNAELVRGISDCLSIVRAVEETTTTREIYEDLVRAAGRAEDAHFWLHQPGVGNLAEPLKQIRNTAELVISEFDKVVAIRERARSALANTSAEQAELVTGLRPDSWSEIGQFMQALTGLRRQRGHLISLRDQRYMDLEAVDRLEREVGEQFDRVSRGAQRFLLTDNALAPLLSKLHALESDVRERVKSSEVSALQDELGEVSEGVSVLSEVVQSLQSDDPTERTRILQRISEVFGQLNRVRGLLDSRFSELATEEGRAEFHVQFQLLKQSVDGALGMARTPESCDEQLARLMVQLEELEARFGEFDEFMPDLTRQREELHEAFAQKKQQMLDERQRRANNTLAAADRILKSLARRARSFENADELNGFFASDPMVLKLLDLAKVLSEQGDPTKAGELESRLKTARQEALRTLRDKQELFVGGEHLIQFGRHQFEVNTEPRELTLVPHGQQMALTLTGTDFREPIVDPEFANTRPFWTQALVSETKQVYRGEFLAGSLLLEALEGTAEPSLQALQEARLADGDLLALVRQAASLRYDEGYERGVHDHDAAVILDRLLSLEQAAGRLAYEPSARTWGCLFWALAPDQAAKQTWQRRAQSLGRLARAFRSKPAALDLSRELQAALLSFAELEQLDFGDNVQDLAYRAARYLLDELSEPEPRFATRARTEKLVHEFFLDMQRRGVRQAFAEDLQQLTGNLKARWEVAASWLDGYLSQHAENQDSGALRTEAIGVILTEGQLARTSSAAQLAAESSDLVGTHPRIQGGRLALVLDEFLARVSRHRREVKPGFQRYREQRHRVLENARERLGVEELMPKTLSSFVRNRLINEVYLPIIGDNLAKQLGAAGAKRRTDLMGLLLLISPPGYGKTTLMEYVANRLGLVFVKVNGPALGHSVTSLDPAQAANATARQEVVKINLALELGSNVMLYLDDIQHTHPELLQKFISLCDAQRRIEGVWQGRTRTYDLRGKRFCVVMAGNPYTESGERFRIPDMLANRADTYNLGDILEGKADTFALSYVENAITSSPALSPLAARDQNDVYAMIKMAQGRAVQQSELSFTYSAVELEEMRLVLKNLFVVQDALLKVNQAYIASASTDDRFRTEPPFKLQGSYRNMCKLAERVVAAMQPDELLRLLVDHYRGEAQTLTTEAESNLLKLKELLGALDDDERQRWAEIKASYLRAQRLGGSEEDPVTRVTRQLSGLSEELSKIHLTLSDALRSSPRGHD